LNKTSKRIVLV